MEPKSNYIPTYIEFLPEERTINYLYNAEGARLRENSDKSTSDRSQKCPNYVQTTVKENFNAQDADYMKYINQKSSSVSDENDSEVNRIFSHQKDSSDSVIMKTVENIPNACQSHVRENFSRSSISCSETIYSHPVNSPYTLIMQNGGPRNGARKGRLDSTNSVMSFDSVQTEPTYGGHPRGKLYSSSSSKSNYSMSNISEMAIEPRSPDAESKKFWANTSTDCANLVRQDTRTPADHVHMLGRSQVYPENLGTLAGYDVIHASLV